MIENRTYLKVQWIHGDPNDPIWLFSELNAESWETRKVEIYADGTTGYADQSESEGGSWLGLEPVPQITEIASDPQFVPLFIEQDEFEKVWSARKQRVRGTG